MDVRARIAAAALASVSITTLSSALDAQAQPLPAQWSGFYLGGFAGGAWSASDATTTVPCPPFGGWICNAGAPLNGPVVAAAGTGSLNGSGFNGGGTFGYNWQFGGAVAGIETDFGAFGLHGSRTTVSRPRSPNSIVPPGSRHPVRRSTGSGTSKTRISSLRLISATATGRARSRVTLSVVWCGDPSRADRRTRARQGAARRTERRRAGGRRAVRRSRIRKGRRSRAGLRGSRRR